MSTFIGQLIGFAVIVWLVVKYVVPPARTAMRNRQEAVRVALEESASAQAKLASADEVHAKAVENARADGARVTEEARNDSVRIAELAREQADADAERIRAQGVQQVNMLHQQKIRELRGELGAESVRRAEALVREHVADPAAQSETVDRFLDELEAMAASGATSTAVTAVGAPLQLRAASREGLATVVNKFDEVAGGLSTDELGTLADDLVAVARLLTREATLTKYLVKPSEATDEGSPQVRLARRLFAGKIGDRAFDIVTTAAAQRWSSDHDVIGAIEHVSRLALLARAERLHDAEEVEDQLFRFWRTLDGRPRLSTLLSDYKVPAGQRNELLNALLDRAGSVNSVTRSLLAQSVELVHGERIENVVAELAELAVVRRGEVVARVSAAAPLSDSQRTRLAEVLSRIYGHPVSVQLVVEPQLLGGLQIAVGDEVIDGSISSRLAEARTGLPE